MLPAIKSLGLGAGRSWYSRTQASRRVMNSAGAMSSPKSFREGSFREGPSRVDVDDCLLVEFLVGDLVAPGFVLGLGTADFRGFGVAFALALGVALALGRTVVELGSEASKSACAVDEISVGPSLGPMAVSGCCWPFPAIRRRVLASASVLATSLVVVFIFFAGFVLAAVRAEEFAASGFDDGVVGFVGKGSTLLGGSIWLRLKGAVVERSRYGSGALLVGRISSSRETVARLVNSGLDIMLVFGPSWAMPPEAGIP